ncbi:MAG: cupin domain-containing protein [Syntrophorhabdaceae bacterium]|nr:cupin domain-containing protein [Syntrophorhabdaceae bacterium]
MHGCWNPENLASRKIAPGVIHKLAWGDKLMLSLVTLEPHAVIPTHSHPHEQMGVMISGKVELAIAEEILPLSGNAMFMIPGMTFHAFIAGPEGATLVEAFSPPREEYKTTTRD